MVKTWSNPASTWPNRWPGRASWCLPWAWARKRAPKARWPTTKASRSWCALATKGDYYPLGSLGEGLAKVRLAVEKTDFASGPAPVRKLGVDRFHVPIAVVLGLLVVESLIGTRRRITA